jgi:hypothetical protein
MAFVLSFLLEHVSSIFPTFAFNTVSQERIIKQKECCELSDDLTDVNREHYTGDLCGCGGGGGDGYSECNSDDDASYGLYDPEENGTLIPCYDFLSQSNDH